MSDLNKWSGIGHLGSDPVIKHLEGGQTVATFSVATSEKYKNQKGELIESTEWTSCVAWGKLAEVCEKYIKKGSQVYVEGPKKTRSYDNKDGQKVYVTEIVINTLQMLSKAENSAPANNSPVQSAKENKPVMESFDLTPESEMPF